MTHRHGALCCWCCYAGEPMHAGPIEGCPGIDLCPLSTPLARAFLPALTTRVLGAMVYPRSDLCRQCLAQRVVAPADDASTDYLCRGHLAEGRINDMLRDGLIKGWWT